MHIALREAFVNCLIHCDYTVSSNIIVESYRNKYVFTNPGTLLISLSQYYIGGESKCRNQSLQKMFMQIGDAEKAGSGADKIIKGWKSANYKNPDLEEGTDKVRLTLPLESILSDDVLNTLKQVYGDEVVSIDHEKLLVLAACASDGYTSNFRIQLVLEKHPSDITQLLKSMCQDGYLISSGIGKGTTYNLNEEFLARRETTAPNESISTEAEQYVHTTLSAGGPGFPNVESSPSNVDSSISNVDGLASNVDGSASNVDGSASNVDSSSTSVIGSNSLSKPKRGKTDQLQLQKMILSFCRLQFMSIEEIAQGVGKSIKYLKNSIIPRMVAEGQLERKYPNIPSHPDQRYKASNRKEEVEPTLF